jgi:hypothetical protein
MKFISLMCSGKAHQVRTQEMSSGGGADSPAPTGRADYTLLVHDGIEARPDSARTWTEIIENKVLDVHARSTDIYDTLRDQTFSPRSDEDGQEGCQDVRQLHGHRTAVRPETRTARPQFVT